MTARQMARIRPAFQFQRLGLVCFFAMGGGRIGIAAVSADQPIHHRFQPGWRVIPVHRRHDHYSVGRDPQRVDLVHPVVSLAQRIIRVAATRPMTQRHGSRDAGLARMNLLAEFRGKAAKIENVDSQSHFLKHGFGYFDQPPGFGHLARTGVLAARRAVDQEDARCLVAIIMTALRGKYCLACREPIYRNLIIRIGKTRACLACHGRFSGIAIAIPRCLDNGIYFSLQWSERRIGEAAAETFLEFLARQFDGRHSPADVDTRHRSIPDLREQLVATMQRRAGIGGSFQG
jgi:hypothetical protein